MAYNKKGAITMKDRYDVEMVEVVLYAKGFGFITRITELTDNLADVIDTYRTLCWRVIRVSRFTAYNYGVK